MIHVTFFFFNDTATTEIYTLSLHDALPISGTSVTAHSVITTRRAKRNRDRNRDLEAELAAKDETIDTNRQTIDSLKERVGQLERDLAELRRSLETATLALNQLRSRYETLELFTAPAAL